LGREAQPRVSITWTLENVLMAADGMLLSGPLLAGYTQTLNDFYDRDIDAINEPTAHSRSNFDSQVVTQILVLLLAGIGGWFACLGWWNFPL